MDTKILRLLLYSCDDIINDVKKSKDYGKLQTNEKFVPTCDDILRALSTSLTNLLSHKVSKEACQRYSVRVHIIDILRTWCRISEKYTPVHVLANSDHTLTFVTRSIKNHLTDEIINNSDSVDSLVSLTSVLICLLPDHPTFKSDIEKLITRLVRVEENEECDNLLCYIAEEDDLDIESSIIEQIYISQKCKLIEEPLLENFKTFNNLNDKDNKNNIKLTRSLNRLIDYIVKFVSIFQLTASFLKELFKYFDYAPIVLSFIQWILKQIVSNCDGQGKDIIDLYPRRFQFCVIMLKIEPSVHSDSSKKYTLDALQNVFRENEDVALILLSHFPLWFQEFYDYEEKMNESLNEISV